MDRTLHCRHFETEIRRRLWWHICLLDMLSSGDPEKIDTTDQTWDVRAHSFRLMSTTTTLFCTCQICQSPSPASLDSTLHYELPDHDQIVLAMSFDELKLQGVFT